ncbi:MAG TPA: glucosamine-6-phosphate deaminase [Vicinamibacterales bacterium]|nr:glucosamine-6-phosphate deaminase [Vicinamibacterales bacterium]
MTITVLNNSEEVADALAQRIASALRAKPDAVLGLASGRTPVDGYAEMQRMHAAGKMDWSRASTFNLDEFAGVAATHRGSFRSFMEEHLFRGVNLQRNRIHFLDGVAADLDAECRRYEQAIAAAGGIDLQLLGIGSNGHVGFNEPADDLPVHTHRVTLMESTRRDNAALFGNDPSRVPREALSMGIGTILHARRIVLVATGEKKADCVRQTVNGRITTRVPASMLQLHRDVELLLDREAASRIRPT